MADESVQASSQGAVPPAVVPRSVSEWVAIGSLTCYVTGFAGAATSLSQAGVPLGAISNVTFVAAGVLFAAIVGTGWALAQAASVAWRSPGSRLDRVVAVLAVGLFAYHFASILGGWRPGALIVASSVLLSRWHLTRLPQVALGLTILYAAYVYSSVHDYYGGGEPRVIARVPVSHGVPWAKEPTPWFDLLCKTPASESGLSACRTLYRVYENERHLYLAVEDSPRSCETQKPRWEAWSLLPDRDFFCYMRMPSDKMDVLHFPHVWLLAPGR